MTSISSDVTKAPRQPTCWMVSDPTPAQIPPFSRCALLHTGAFNQRDHNSLFVLNVDSFHLDLGFGLGGYLTNGRRTAQASFASCTRRIQSPQFLRWVLWGLVRCVFRPGIKQTSPFVSESSACHVSAAPSYLSRALPRQILRLFQNGAASSYMCTPHALRPSTANLLDIVRVALPLERFAVLHIIHASSIDCALTQIIDFASGTTLACWRHVL